MRYFSKRYKKKITVLLHLAKINDLSLAVVLEALKGRSDTKQDQRYRRRFSERIVWNEASISSSCVAFPLETLRGKRLSSLSVCFTVEHFHALEDYYSRCPKHIASKVIAALSE